jgi:hypothetical protein
MVAITDNMEAKQARRVPENTSGRWFCRQCGLAINQGYSWNGLCVVCARPYLDEDLGGLRGLKRK